MFSAEEGRATRSRQGQSSQGEAGVAGASTPVNAAAVYNGVAYPLFPVFDKA